MRRENRWWPMLVTCLRSSHFRQIFRESLYLACMAI
jgi:hypothetical protein